MGANQLINLTGPKLLFEEWYETKLQLKILLQLITNWNYNVHTQTSFIPTILAIILPRHVVHRACFFQFTCITYSIPPNTTLKKANDLNFFVCLLCSSFISLLDQYL